MHQKIEIGHAHIADLIEDSLKKYADKPAYSCLGQTLSFAEIDKKSRALACWLQSQDNLKAGDRIIIQLPNLIQYPIAAYAAFRAGLILVNTNPLYTPREMQYQFKDSGAKAIIILEDMLPKLSAIKDETDIQYVITTGAADLITGSMEAADGCFSFNQIINDHLDSRLLSAVKAEATDLCLLQYTGGTTGASKGACLTHHNLLSNVEQMALRMGSGCKDGEEIFICPLPLYHIYAFCVNMIYMASRGNLNVLIPNPRDMSAFITALKPFKFTALSGLNTLFVGLCSQPEFKQLDFSALHLTLSGGTALSSSAVEQWKAVTSCSITEGYGLSETSPVVCFNEPGNEKLGTVGQPLAGTEVQLWNEQDQPVTEGQIVVRGPQVMQGYWNKPEETAEVMTADGFFKTGDIGVLKDNGCIQIIDRLKDMIIVSGFNVYPNEVEDVLTQHPAIVEAAVIGEQDSKTGEKVSAYIVVADEVDNEQIEQHCRNLLTPYKVPRKITVLPELPKSAVGKILRRALRQ